MTLLPIDTDVLEDVCRDIAKRNYGFIYVADQKSEIKTGYEGADVGTLNARSLSASDMRKALQELAADEFTEIRQLRDGVYYVDPFGMKGHRKLTEKLTGLFGQRLVVTGETLRSQFSLAVDDVDFFVDELADRNYIRRITAGKHDYYTIGPALKEHADDVGLDARLAGEATNGKIAHSDLESVIDVAATSDVIRYLDREGYIVDLDGAYLVEDAIDEYAAFLAREIEDAIEAELEESKYVLPNAEFEQIVSNEIQDRFDVLSHARSVADEIVELTTTTLAERLGVERGREFAVQTAAFDEYATAEATRILADVRAENETLPGKIQGYLELAEDHVEELHVSNIAAVNEHVRTEVRDRYRTVVNEEEFGGLAE